MFVDAVGDQEFRIFGPAIISLGEPDLLFPERLAVGGRGVLLVRRAPAYVAIYDDERGAISGLRERAETVTDHFQVIGVGDMPDVPSIGGESRAHVVGK